MKYNININQLALSKTTLDIADCAILDWMITICNSKNKKIESRRKDGFTQIDYKKLIDDMPLLRIKSKGAISLRVKRIEENGFITVNRAFHQSNFIQLTDKIDSLFIGEAVHENEQDNNSCSVSRTELFKKTNRAVQFEEPIIILDNNTNINIAKDKPLHEKVPEIIKAFENINIACKKMYGNTTQRKACDELITNFSFERVKTVIEKTLPITNGMEFFPTITTPLELHKKWTSLESAIRKYESKKLLSKSKVAF